MLSVDAIDSSGEQQFGVEHNIFKQRISVLGMPLQDAELGPINKTHNKTEEVTESSAAVISCGSCYGAKEGCCDTCADVRDAYRLKVYNFEAHWLKWLITDFKFIFRIGPSDLMNLSSVGMKEI